MKTDLAEKVLAWKLNWFRQSELEGALLLGKMVRTTSDPWLIERLTEHCSEEAFHSRLWSEVIKELELPQIRILRSYQSFYISRSGLPTSLLEVLSFTNIFERRVHQHFQKEFNDPGTPAEAKRAYRCMMDDEKGHLSWVTFWLRGQPESPKQLARFAAIDRQVFNEISGKSDRLWEIPNLGDENNV
jgi:hypothetical protein